MNTDLAWQQPFYEWLHSLCPGIYGPAVVALIEEFQRWEPEYLFGVLRQALETCPSRGPGALLRVIGTEMDVLDHKDFPCVLLTGFVTVRGAGAPAEDENQTELQMSFQPGGAVIAYWPEVDMETRVR